MDKLSKGITPGHALALDSFGIMLGGAQKSSGLIRSYRRVRSHGEGGCSAVV
jgi:hypothetical protein